MIDFIIHLNIFVSTYEICNKHYIKIDSTSSFLV